MPFPADEIGTGRLYLGTGRPALAPAAGARKRKPDPTPHGLVLMWCLWLLGTWVVVVGFSPSVPAARWLIFACLIGLMALWPALRLSQELIPAGWMPPLPGAGGVASPNALQGGSTPLGGAWWRPRLIFTDWFCLLLVFQVVLWPLRLSTRWSVPQAAWLDAAVAAWSLLTGAVIVFFSGPPGANSAGIGTETRSGSGGRRAWGMAACVALLLAEPLLLGLVNFGASQGGGAVWPLRVSPIQVIWELAGPPDRWAVRAWRPQILSAAFAAGLAWAWMRLRVSKMSA